MAKRNRKNQQSFPETRQRVELSPSTAAQRVYLTAIRNNDITFGVGPAGTGKTYMAALMAMYYQTEGLVDRIVIARPAVNAGGEDIGFLPGGIQSKMDPYVRPIFDAFRTYWSQQTIQDHMARGTIEIVPLAFMRGRTFTDTFIVADEMQNATPENLLMLLTRLGDRSKMVITGDPLQSDVNGHSCFRMAQSTLRLVDEVKFVTFMNSDIVRHPTVEKILNVWQFGSLSGVDAIAYAA
jgi:phosphate starvation-inducible PhoH-like protein